MSVICVVVEGRVSGVGVLCRGAQRLDCDDVVCINLELFIVVDVCVIEVMLDADLDLTAGFYCCFLKLIGIGDAKLLSVRVRLDRLLCRLIVVAVDLFVILLYGRVSESQNLAFDVQVFVVLGQIFVVLLYISFILSNVAGVLSFNCFFRCLQACRVLFVDLRVLLFGIFDRLSVSCLGLFDSLLFCCVVCCNFFVCLNGFLYCVVVFDVN